MTPLENQFADGGSVGVKYIPSKRINAFVIIIVRFTTHFYCKFCHSFTSSRFLRV